MFLAMDLSFLRYLNFIFYVVLGLAILVGFSRGLKKTLFSFITMAIFYIVFFVTINQAVNFLWTFEMPWLGGILGNVDPSLSNFTSFENSLESILQFALGDTVDLQSVSGEVLVLATGLVQFVVKIVYTILYFTVILLLYKLLCLIIRAIFFKSKKGESKNRLFGAIFGAANGVMAIFVMMIMLGGIMSVVDSTIQLVGSQSDFVTLSLEEEYNWLDGNQTVIPLAETTELDSLIDDLQLMVDDYNSNIVVSLANSITTPSTINPDVEVPLHLDLFDRVLSFEYHEAQVGLRYELAVFSSAGSVLLESDYIDTNELSDITGDEIRSFFSEISKSELIVNLMPVAIEVAAGMYEMDLDVEAVGLYDIDFETELANLGSIAGALFDIINGAGFIGGEGSVDQIEIDGDAVRDIFEDISGSETILLITENLLFPMLEAEEGGFSAILTVPDDLDLEAEFLALGEIFAQIIDADIDFADLEGADVTVLLGAVSEIDLTILLDSQLVTEALINILSGQTEVEGLDVLTIPQGIEWRDQGAEAGELRKILVALNSFVGAVGELDFSTIDVSTLTDLDQAVIDDFFASYIIRATVSDIISSTDLGDVPLVIPETVYDLQGYFTETELVSIIKAIKLIIDDTSGDFDIVQALSLTDTEIDDLLASDIIYATIGKEIYDLGSSSLVVPSTVVETVVDDSVNVTVVTRLEQKAILQALAVLAISDFDTMSFDAGIIGNLENSTEDGLDDTKIATLLGSEIIHSTVSDMIIDLDTSNGGVLVIPDTAPDGSDLVYSNSFYTHVAKAEISNILKALYEIDITDFNTINLEDTSLLINNMSDLLQSGIIHATVSDILLDLSPTVTIPEKDSLDQSILIVQGTTTYISSDEISAMMDALNVLNITDPSAFASSFDLTYIDETTEQDTLLLSAIMHATISQTMMDLGSGVMVIPQFEEDGITPVVVQTGSVGNLTDYIVKDEIKAIIDALNQMGLNDLDALNSEISSSLFLNNSSYILASSCLQATLSDQILSNTSGTILIPDSEVVTSGTVQYIKNTELTNFINSINELGLSDFDTFGFASDDIFGLTDVNGFFNSKIMQATASKYILDAAVLTVPSSLQQTILVNSANVNQINKTELVSIFNSLELLGMTGFDSPMDSSVIQGITKADLTTILDSGSLHVTIDDMLRGNAALDIPDLANSPMYGIDPLTSKTEIVEFIEAVNQFGGADFTNFTFNVAGVAALNATQRSEVLDSMIIRNGLTTELEALMLADDPLDLYWPADALYMNNDNTTFLTEAGVNDVLTHYSLI